MWLRVLTCLSALFFAREAWGQACCAGTGAIAPARLAPHEDALAGIQLRGAVSYGSFGSTGKWTATPAGASEAAFEQDIYASARVSRRIQIATLVPLVETRREVSGITEMGGGLGDVGFNGRWDVLFPHNVPGIALLAGVTLPTGRPVELARRPLATDATGLGVVQGSLGAALEHIAGSWLLNASVIVSVRSPRFSGPVQEVLMPKVTSTVAATYVFRSGIALALLLAYDVEADAFVDGVQVPRTGRRDPQAMFAFVVPLSDTWRAQATAFAHPPIPSLGQNVLASAGASMSVTRTWW